MTFSRDESRFGPAKNKFPAKNGKMLRFKLGSDLRAM